jgi:sulfite reductase alpha subunit-like flavoprotein
MSILDRSDTCREENEDSKEKKIRQKITVNPETMKYGPVNIYYASHTGTAENFAEDLKEEGAQKGIWCEPINVKNFEVNFSSFHIEG